MLNTSTSLLQQLSSVYLFGQRDFPQPEKKFEIKDFYNSDELNELELKSSEPESKLRHAISKLNMDWDTFPGSMRNSAASIFDAFFSSIGSKFAQSLGFTPKLAITAGTFMLSMLGNEVKLPFISDKLSLFNYSGRLLRAPLHFFDSIFSVIGESWSGSNLVNLLSLGTSTIGLSNSLKNPDDFKKNNDLDYQTINGTLGRSSLHNLQSMTSSFAQHIYEKSPLLGTATTLALTGLGLSLPKEIKDHDISWKSINGLLTQNLFHFSDSLYSGLGSLVTKGLLKSQLLSFSLIPVLAGLGLNKTIQNLMSKKLVFTKFNSKTLRSMIHMLDTVVFNLGTEFSKTKLALPFVGLYTLLSSLTLPKDKPLPTIPEFKIEMNTVGGLLQRVPFDFIESVISASSNKFGQKIPAPILALIGPSLSYKLGNLFKDAKTPFNTSTGLMLKHMIHFWDNLLTSSGYSTGKSLMNLFLPSDDKKYSGSILSDGRWMTSDGRIVSKMALGKQLAS